MSVNIGFSNSYFWLDSWVLANVLQLSTQSFCDRFVDFRIDPERRLYDQMVLAARSVPANIAEGSARHDTSIETEMRLTDVGRGSLCELQGDFLNFILRFGGEVWSNKSEAYRQLMSVRLDPPRYSDDLMHDVGEHIKQQKAKFDLFVECQDPVYCANALLFLTMRLITIVRAQILSQLDAFKANGGFKENMTETRLEAKRQSNEREGAPHCRLCGAVMVLRTIRQGERAGMQFWGCSNFYKTHCDFKMPYIPKP